MRSHTRAVFTLALACIALITPSFAQTDNTFFDDFTGCVNGKPDPSKWNLVSRQWGCSNCNGGVNPDNVACAVDPDIGQTVLQLTAHGDLYTGTGPTGIYRNRTMRDPNDEFTGWAFDGYTPSCAPYCNVRRVGGAVYSNQLFAGTGSNITMEVVMKPCNQYGAGSAIWMYNYTEVYCFQATGNTCPPDYQDWCCGGKPCMGYNDKCQGEWVKNLEIDIELPTSTGTSVSPSSINFADARFTSITAVNSVDKALCSSSPPCQDSRSRNLNIDQMDGKYHLYSMTWVPPNPSTGFNGTVSFSVDGVFQAELQGSHIVPELGQLWLGAWFPNAWAGSPAFDTCTLSVQSVKIYPNN